MASARHRRLAAALGAAVVVEFVAAVACSVAVGWSFGEAIDAFVVSNCVIGLSFGLCGAVIAWHRPRHPVGWLYAAGGAAMLATAVAAPVARLLADADAPIWLARLTLTIFNYSWPLHIGVALPISLLLLPDGHLPSRRWRPVLWFLTLTAPLFVVEIGLSPSSPAGLPSAYLTTSAYDDLHTVWSASEGRWALTMLVGLVAIGLRYKRGDDRLRRQLLWPLTSTLVILAAVLPWALVAGTPIVVLFTIPLLPLALTVGILRYQLLDIRLVIARGVAYALLSALVLAGYAVLVASLSGVVSALVVALAALPLRARLQRAVEHLFYGERGDPLRVAARVGDRLAVGVDDSVAEIRAALRLPYVAIRVDGATVAESGVAADRTASIGLADSGELVIGLRQGEQTLSAADERVLHLLGGPLATAVLATRLSKDLQTSRERLVAAREEERRRLRRDLHDGLGPLLTGVALSADAAANVSERSPHTAEPLLASVRADSRTAIAEIRRIIDDLRPPALDELGLVGALEVRAARTSTGAHGEPIETVIDAPEDLPPLPAAIEVAAYRIATEAITNAVRHSEATRIVVRLRCDEALQVYVVDNGAGSASWIPGVGISGMRERVDELGGSLELGPSATGGEVRVRLPVGVR